MKKNIYLSAFLLVTSFIVNAQEKPLDVKYRRSSLHTMVVETDKFPKKEVVLNAFNNAPFPEKYNDHQIGVKSFNPNNYPLTNEEKATIYKQSKLASFAKSTAGLGTDSLSKELPLKIQKYLAKEKIANQLVAKWFNRQPDGSFDGELIAERGIFNASYLELKSAESSSDGNALLKTAGFELIDNTFVVINKFNYVANEPIARAMRGCCPQFWRPLHAFQPRRWSRFRRLCHDTQPNSATPSNSDCRRTIATRCFSRNSRWPSRPPIHAQRHSPSAIPISLC